MKTAVLAAMVAALVPASAALAQPPGPPSFDSIDTNHDGGLSQEEVAAMIAARGAGRGRPQGDRPDGPPPERGPGDPNARGGGPGGPGGPPNPEGIFRSWDKDGNGSVSKEEFDARPRPGPRGGGPGPRDPGAQR